MTNSKIWLVVKPSVGVPLFFAGVALTALTVHAAVLSNTTWFAAYWQGKNRPAAAAIAPSATPAAYTLADLQK